MLSRIPRHVFVVLLPLGTGFVIGGDAFAACVELSAELARVGVSAHARPLPVPARPNGRVASSNLESLMTAAGLSLPELYLISVNGVVMEVGEMRVAAPLAQKLVAALHEQAQLDSGWRVSTGGANRVVLSRWAGARHEALSLRPSGNGSGCLANYSRQDLRRPAAQVARSPVRLPREFTLLTATEEKTALGVMQLFTFDYLGSSPQARQRLLTALQASQWRLEGQHSEDEPRGKSSDSKMPVFAARGGDRLRAALVTGAGSTRLVMQVSRSP